MKYMLLMIDDGTEWPGPEEIARMPEWVTWQAEMQGRGLLRGGGRLRPPTQATTVRVRDGEVLVSDGPFAETKEAIGGFEFIECADLDDAIEVAGKHPTALWNAIEVRPFWTEES
jgi:hypothetical protein